MLFSVMRTTINHGADGDDEPASIGCLYAYTTDGAELVPPTTWWTLDETRLRALLAMAANGHDIDGLVLDLEAAALASEDEWEDEDGDSWPT